MPVKTCVCSICGATVTKASTYHVGEGKRACKIHEGVVAKATEMSEKDRQRQIAVTTEHTYKKEHPHHLHPVISGNPSTPKCWRCGTEGIYEQEFWMKRLVAMEKSKIVHGKELNPFSPNHPMHQHSDVCIYRLPKDVLKGGKMDKMPNVSNCLIEFSGLVCLCTKCMDVMKIELPGCKDITLDKLVKAGAVYDVFIKPAIAEMAKKELARDN